MNKVRVWTAAAMLTAALGLIYAAGPGRAGDEKALRGAVLKIAAAVKKGDMEGAKKMAAVIGKKAENMEDVMDLLKPKNKGGLGFGPGPTDGIERKMLAIARDGPKAAEVPHVEDAAYVIVAISLIAEGHTGKVPETNKKKRKDWEKFSEDMKTAGMNLAKAGMTKAPASIRTAATKVNNSCSACHSIFRD
jgi:hypothetical protein